MLNWCCTTIDLWTFRFTVYENKRNSKGFTLKDESGEMHSDCPGLYRRHNYIYLLRFKVLMEPIILVVIKLIGAAFSGHWDLRDTGTIRETMTLLRAVCWVPQFRKDGLSQADQINDLEL